MDLSLSSSNEEESRVIRVKKIKDKSDPLSLSETAFKTKFNLSKEAFNAILCQLKFMGHMKTAVPPKFQLAATLSLLTSGSSQHSVGNDYLVGLGQSKVSKIVSHVIQEIETKIYPKFVKFSPEESFSCMDYFLKNYNIPGVIGCVDGTHIVLQRPPQNESMFFNRKGYYSLNAMMICDHEHKILSINSKYGGATQDSFVWMQSSEKLMLEKLYNDKHCENVLLLGDSGYPLEPWLITPYRNPDDGSMEAHFNEIHSKARCIIERTIGILKARWKILCNEKIGRYSPEKVASFVNVCVALHNVCIYFNVPNYTNNSIAETIPPESDDENETEIGKIVRDNIKLSLWSSDVQIENIE